MHLTKGKVLNTMGEDFVHTLSNICLFPAPLLNLCILTSVKDFAISPLLRLAPSARSWKVGLQSILDTWFVATFVSLLFGASGKGATSVYLKERCHRSLA